MVCRVFGKKKPQMLFKSSYFANFSILYRTPSPNHKTIFHLEKESFCPAPDTLEESKAYDNIYITNLTNLITNY